MIGRKITRKISREKGTQKKVNIERHKASKDRIEIDMKMQQKTQQMIVRMVDKDSKTE